MATKTWHAESAGVADHRLTQTKHAGRDMSQRLSLPSHEPWLAFAVAVTVAGMWGVIAGVWTPRGPLTAGEALATMAGSLAVGVAAGLVMRSRWSLLAAPTAFVAAFELVRIGADGPNVDAIHFTEYGAIAFVVGRGFNGLVALVPMLLGAVIGAAIARHLTRMAHGEPAPAWTLGRGARVAVTAVVAVGMVALALGLAARPLPTRSWVPTATRWSAASPN